MFALCVVGKLGSGCNLTSADPNPELGNDHIAHSEVRTNKLSPDTQQKGNKSQAYVIKQGSLLGLYSSAQ